MISSDKKEIINTDKVKVLLTHSQNILSTKYYKHFT